MICNGLFCCFFIFIIILLFSHLLLSLGYAFWRQTSKNNTHIYKEVFPSLPDCLTSLTQIYKLNQNGLYFDCSCSCYCLLLFIVIVVYYFLFLVLVLVNVIVLLLLLLFSYFVFPQ